MRTALVMAVSLALAPLPAFSAPRVAATLSLQQHAVLPGLPASMRVTLESTAAEPLTLTDWLRLHVTPVNGQPPFIAHYEDRDYVEVLSTGLVSSLVIPANGTLVIDFPVTPNLESVGWFADRRLSRPGQYRLRVEVADPSTPAYAPGYQTLITNEESLEVLQPSGQDAAVWAVMQAKTGGAGFGLMDWAFHGSEIASAIDSQYGSSGYLPYVAYWVPTPRGAYATRLEHIERALGTGVQGPVREMLLLAKAHVAVAWAGDAFYGRRDIDRAASASTTARAAIDALLAESSSAYMTAQASKLLTEALTRAEWVTKDAWLASLGQPGTPRPVTPRLQCVKETGNRLEASFSYSNPNSFSVTIPIGERNRFAPDPQNRQQPTTFLPGLHEAAVTVVVDGKKKDPNRRIAWTLDGATVAAPADDAPKCKNR